MYLGHNRASCQTPSNRIVVIWRNLWLWNKICKKSKTEIRKKRKEAANRDFEHF